MTISWITGFLVLLTVVSCISCQSSGLCDCATCRQVAAARFSPPSLPNLQSSPSIVQLPSSPTGLGGYYPRVSASPDCNTYSSGPQLVQLPQLQIPQVQMSVPSAPHILSPTPMQRNGPPMMIAPQSPHPSVTIVAPRVSAPSAPAPPQAPQIHSYVITPSSGPRMSSSGSDCQDHSPSISFSSGGGSGFVPGSRTLSGPQLLPSGSQLMPSGPLQFQCNCKHNK